jgi:hypothetical protein
LISERFIFYSTETRKPVVEVHPDELAEEQSWTAFPFAGAVFVVSAPLKLTRYHLP